MFSRRRRPQRKRKNVVVKDPETFFIDIEESFELMEPEDVFHELSIDNTFRQNVVPYLDQFCERCFCGRYGLIAGDRLSDPPLESSFLGCKEEKLNTWLEEFGKLCHSFTTIKNKMDAILPKFLQSALSLPDEIQQRVFKISAKIVSMKIYNKSHSQDFYLTALFIMPHYEQIIAKALNTLKNELNEQEIFTFCLQYEFVKTLENQEHEIIFQECDWFKIEYEKYQYQTMIDNQVIKVAQLIKDVNFEHFEEELENVKDICKEQFLQVVQKAIFVILGQLNKQNFSTDIDTLFVKIIPYIQQLVQTVPQQAEFMDVIQNQCYQNPSLHDNFKQILLLFYKNQIIDGRVIIAWFDRADGKGKKSFTQQINQFCSWLKE
eukprot:EST43976.1 Elongation initiation factor 5C [Spironucleus salmonicida]